MSEKIYPLRFVPVYKDYIWGGDRIKQLFSRTACPPVCAESWEVSDRPEGMSIIANGMLAGSSLHQLVESMPLALFGRDRTETAFPLLLKLIDAGQRLSVQVHPDDDTARTLGSEAKTELWYVLAAAPGARVYAGLSSPAGPVAFRQALAGNRVEDLLTPVPVSPGDAIYLPGGTVHAIGEGCVMLEIQQNSNTTYRVYDWNRVDRNGKSRELHVDQALKTIRWDNAGLQIIKHVAVPAIAGNTLHRIIASPYFTFSRLDLTGVHHEQTAGAGFHIIFVQKGKVSIEGAGSVETLTTGETCLLPAAISEYSLTPKGGPATLISITR